LPALQALTIAPSETLRLAAFPCAELGNGAIEWRKFVPAVDDELVVAEGSDVLLPVSRSAAWNSASMSSKSPSSAFLPLFLLCFGILRVLLIMELTKKSQGKMVD
jgi:hypothetical protein